MKWITPVLVLILIVAVGISGCTSSASENITKNYSANGISFNYPGDWTLFDDPSNIFDDSLNISIIDIPSNSSGPITSFEVQTTPLKDLSEQSAINQFKKIIVPSGWKKISSNTLTINSKTANEIIYTDADTNINQHMRYATIFFVKKGNIYTITLAALDKDFDNEKSNFDIIINSFKVQ